MMQIQKFHLIIQLKIMKFLMMNQLYQHLPLKTVLKITAGQWSLTVVTAFVITEKLRRIVSMTVWQTLKCYIFVILAFLAKWKKGFRCLKLVPTIFYPIFIFSSSDRPSKTMKNAFHFILKALLVLEIFKFL